MPAIPKPRRLGDDARGAVFVEKLIVYLPLLITFFAAWELAEFGAASLVVQRASAAAGRAAIVVLPDDPVFYDDEPVDSFDGQRRADIELAAGMILSSNPHLTDDFAVDIPEVPRPAGKLEVTVTASYDCGTVSILCGDDAAAELSSTTTHIYQGARYVYGSPDLGTGSAALASTAFRAGTSRDGCAPPCEPLASQRPAPRYGPNTPFTCPRFSEADLERRTNQLPMVQDPSTGHKLDGPYGKRGLSETAFTYRCSHKVPPNKNIAVVRWECIKDGKRVTGESIDVSESSDASNWQHSEQKALLEFEQAAREQGFDPATQCTPLEIYTERDCCYAPSGGSCNDFFANGNQGTTKNPAIATPPDKIKQLGENVSWHLDYNNAYKRFDRRRCGTSEYAGAQAKALCKELEDGDEACKELNLKGSNCGTVAGKVNGDNWVPPRAEQDRLNQQYRSDLEEWRRRRSAHQADPGKACDPGDLPKRPDFRDPKKIEDTPANRDLVAQCMNAMALAEAFEVPVHKDATDAIAEEMERCPDTP